MFYDQVPINEIVTVLSNESTSSVCILDNNFISFILSLQKHVTIESVFKNYQYVLIPKWVYNEIQSSPYRIKWIMDLALQLDIYIIDELDYSELSDYRDRALLLFFLSSTFLMGEVCEQLRQTIKSHGPEIDVPSVITKLYDVILPEVMGRNQNPKNAGEISIVVLANILRYYYPHIKNITIFSFDKDCYHFMTNSRNQLLNETKIKNIKNIFKGRETLAPTFKTNDFILKELYDLKSFTDLKILQKIRTNSRIVKYIQIQTDGSIAEYQHSVDTTKFIQLIQMKSVKIIF